MTLSVCVIPWQKLSSGALALFLVSTSLTWAQYPPETQAIPIPKVEDLPLTPGPFTDTVDSLKQYKCPEWFRDAKFGIWAHWGPQAVPGDGDWYARNMYEEGNGDYEDHIKVYGHPSKSGYKDIIPLWKAEKWDPNHLMELYKAAGARYFVAQAVHHDNFDNWNSKYHKWNSVKMGPMKDMVGTWEKAALKQGLHFGVSEHLGASFNWFQGSHGADKNGPLAGVAYDGANPAYFDLYHLPAKPEYSGAWYTNDPVWIQEWYARIYDLIGQYKPDLLYSDGGMPFDETGRRLIAQFYNASIAQHGGKLEAVYNCKDNGSTQFAVGTCVQDVERGLMNDIQPYPWQTDTSTGDWFYRKGDHYKDANEVIHTLTDIVSKNGNLLLNVVQYADGSLPPEMETFLSEMADWMKVNGTAIFGTRPWTVYGEGPHSTKGGAFNEHFDFTADDIRFTRKGNDIYAITLGLPKDQVVIRSLAKGSPLVTGNPTKVTLLGDDSTLHWTRTEDGLVIQLPPTLPCKSALSFKISGLTTVAFIDPPTLDAFKTQIGLLPSIMAGADGSYVLPASSGTTNGSTIRVEGDGDNADVGWWNDAKDSVSWTLKVSQPGTYHVSIEMASEQADSDYVVEVGPEQIGGKTASTGGFGNYQTFDVGTVDIKTIGFVTVTIKPKSADTWKPINIRKVLLKPGSATKAGALERSRLFATDSPSSNRAWGGRLETVKMIAADQE